MPARSLIPESHYATLANAIRANTAPEIVAALANRQDSFICNWYNQPTTTDAWEAAVTRQALFEMMPITSFDGLSAGKRDAWRLMMEQASIEPLDFGKPRLRSAVRDIWPAVNADAILTACTRKATRCEVIFGGSVEASGSVSATDLNIEEALTASVVSVCLSQY